VVVAPQLPGRDKPSVTAALLRELRELLSCVLRSLKSDREMQLAKHHGVSASTGREVYFAELYSTRQRGTNENTHRVLQPPCFKGVLVGALALGKLDQIAAELNARQRKTLTFSAPAKQFSALLL